MTDWRRVAEVSEARCEDLEHQLEQAQSQIAYFTRKERIPKSKYDVSVDATSIITVEAENAQQAINMVKDLPNEAISYNIEYSGTVVIGDSVEISYD